MRTVPGRAETAEHDSYRGKAEVLLAAVAQAMRYQESHQMGKVMSYL